MQWDIRERYIMRIGISSSIKVKTSNEHFLNFLPQRELGNPKLWRIFAIFFTFTSQYYKANEQQNLAVY